MWQTIYESFLRTVVIYLILLTLVRFMDRKIISQMTFFNFVVAITLGSVTASFAISPNNSSVSALTVLITFSLLVIGSGYLHIKSFNLRKLMNAEPVILIEKGKMNNENMKKVRFSIDDLTSMLRKKNQFNVADVEFAVLENDGKLSVLPKSNKKPVTPSDLNIVTKYSGLTKDIIMDGNIMEENLKESQMNVETIKNILRAQGIRDESEVFYAGLDASGNLYVSKKEKEIEKEGEHGIE